MVSAIATPVFIFVRFQDLSDLWDLQAQQVLPVPWGPWDLEVQPDQVADPPAPLARPDPRRLVDMHNRYRFSLLLSFSTLWTRAFKHVFHFKVYAYRSLFMDPNCINHFQKQRTRNFGSMPSFNNARRHGFSSCFPVFCPSSPVRAFIFFRSRFSCSVIFPLRRTYSSFVITPFFQSK